MFSIFKAAGWPMWPLLIVSIIAVALIVERLIYLRKDRILPKGLYEEVLSIYYSKQVNEELLESLSKNSPLGVVFAAGLRASNSPREIMRESMEEAGRVVMHQLERFLTTIGTIAALAPLLGLFGTIVGMIDIFGSQSASGANPAQLAHGISVALYTTEFGLLIAMPTLIFYRHFRALINSFILDMEQQASKFAESVNLSKKAK